MVSENNLAPINFEITATLFFEIKSNFCQPSTVLIHKDRKNIFEHINFSIKSQDDQYLQNIEYDFRKLSFTFSINLN